MKKTLLSFLLILPVFSFGQSAEERPVTEITELRFPYRKGYHMSFIGETIAYDRYNFPESSKPATFTYYLADEVKEKDRWIVNFQYKSISDTDTVFYNKTYLYIDQEGMYYWIENDPSNVRNGKQLKEKEKKTQGIALPLTKDKRWKSFDYGSEKADFYCFTTDTIIELKKGGPVHCFGVASESMLQKEKDYSVRRKSVDYYNQDIGKVVTYTLIYVLFTENGKTKRLSEETYILDDYYKD